MAQAFHAGIDFTVKYPSLIADWHRNSNNVVIVAVPGEGELLGLDSTAYALGLKHHLVTEPDIGDVATAIIVEPGCFAKRMFASYPLALKELVVT